MLELFGVSKCHGIERNGKHNRGYRGVRLVEQPTLLAS
jgi:hypothetical protein